MIESPLVFEPFRFSIPFRVSFPSIETLTSAPSSAKVTFSEASILL